MVVFKYFNLKKMIFLSIFTAVVTSCGSFQYSGYINDGIYETSENNLNQVVVNKEVVERNNNQYYQSAFSEKVELYSDNQENEQLFTDINSYNTTENDSLQKNYGPWGDNKDSVVINIHSYHHNRFWSNWRYPNWMWNYGYGYGNVWGYGYNNYWSKPFPYLGGMYDPFNPFWGYYDSFYYGFGYSYGFGYPYTYYNYWRPYNSWNNYHPYGNNFNTPVSLVSGRRGSRNAVSSRNYNPSNDSNSRRGSINALSSRNYNLSNDSNIRDRFSRSNSNSLSNRLSRIERINNSARVNPNYYNKPLNSRGSSNSLSKPRVNNSSKPLNNHTRPSNNNYKPSRSSNYSSPSYSSPSRSSGSSFSRGGNNSGRSSSSGSSRGGKS